MRLLEERVEQLGANLEQKLLLAVDVVIETSSGETGGLAEVLHRRGQEAPLGEHFSGAVHHVLALSVVTRAEDGPGWGR